VFQIQQAVMQHFGRTRVQLLRGREPRRSYARAIAMYLARTLTGGSLPSIGQAFDRDHTTVMAACRRVKELLDEDPSTRAHLQALNVRLGQAENPRPACEACGQTLDRGYLEHLAAEVERLQERLRVALGEGGVA
jgi:hypothetical protein